MATMNCRVCKNAFFLKPLLQYKGMPKAAQCLPDADALACETGVNLDVFQCAGCGLVQLSNDPVPYYREVIRAAAFSEEMGSFRKKQFVDFVNQYYLKGKKIIELGCGRGEYLSLMQQTRVDGYGIEYSQDSVDYCKQHDLNVVQGFVENASQTINNAPFDAFFILNFLEHVPNQPVGKGC